MRNSGIGGKIVRVGCIAASAAAFAALMYAHASPTHAAQPKLTREIEEHARAPRARANAMNTGSAAQAVPQAADAPIVQPAAAPIAQQPQPQAPAGIVVPDFVGDRLSRARREAKELGLKLIAQDVYGNRIGAGEAMYYKVRKQRTAAGAELAKGGEVRVTVREIAEYAMGY